MERIERILALVVLILVGVLILRHCAPEPPPKIVKVPEVSGGFTPQPPSYIIPDGHTGDSIVYKDSIIYVQSPVDHELLEAYQSAKDSLEQLLLYVDAIQKRPFSNVFEDSLVKITVDGEVSGYLNHVAANYTLKERTIAVPPEPQLRLRLFAGFSLTSSQALDDLGYSLNLSAQTANYRIYGVGWAKIGGQNYYTIRYDHPILTIKK